MLVNVSLTRNINQSILLSMYQETLKEAGLKKGEAEIYSILLETGPKTAKELIQRTNHKKGMVYKHIEELEERDLISKRLIPIQRGSKTSKKKEAIFEAKHPYKILENIEHDIKVKKAQESSIQAALPQMISSFNVLENKPGVRILEGVDGVKAVYEDTLREGAEILAIIQASAVDPLLKKWLDDYYVKERVKKGIKARVIVAEDSKAKEYTDRNDTESRITKLVPSDKFPAFTEINIYGSKVAFILKKNEYVGIIINNPLISESMKALFNISWESIH